MKSNKSRLYNSVKNSFAGSLNQILIIILGFVSQTIFIRTLGATYLGIKGLFTNILSVLSFTDLGIGTAFTFSLYEPLAKNDKKTIAQVMHLFKHIYECIGITIGIIGIMVIPFIHYFTHVHIKYLYIYYLLFLLNTVVSYFLTYKRTILDADQLSYINLTNQVVFKVIQIFFQCAILIVFKSFMWFLIVQCITNFLSNITISQIVNNKYEFLNQKQYLKDKISKNKFKEIMSHALGTIGQKIGSIIVNDTDNMLISYFIGLAMVGIYSNYMLIINSLSGISNKIFQSIASSIGNLKVERNNDKDYQYKIFDESLYMMLFYIFIISICLIVLINPFIKFWAGKNYKLPFIVVLLLVINFIINGFRIIFQTFITAYGLYVKDGKKSIIEAVLNLIFSLIYIKMYHMGVAGVILGTITSSILVSWYEPYIILKYGIRIKNKFINSILKISLYLITVIIFSLCFGLLMNKFIIVNNFIELIIYGFIVFIFSIILFILLFGKSKYFKLVTRMMFKILER